MNIRSKLATFLAFSLIIIQLSITTGFSGPASQSVSAAGEPASPVLPLNDARGHWAESAIAEMYAKEVMKGYRDSSFRPNKPVSFLEAVVLLDRLLGYTPSDEDIESGAYLSDVFNIPDWAAGYVSIALKRQVIEYSQIQKISLRQPLTRQDGAVLAVIALNLSKQARQKKSADLPFSDVAQIDQNTRGCIAVILERQVMNGYPDGTFQPSGPVSRAEMAVLLSNIGQQIPYINSGETSGFIKSVNITGKEIIIESGEQQETKYTLPDHYLLYLNNKPADIGALTAGNHIRIIDSASATPVVLIAKTVSPDTGLPVPPEQVQLISESADVKQWVETNKTAENYLVKVLNNKVYILATRGEQMTSGYTVNITKVSVTTDEKSSHFRVWLDRTDPSPGMVVNPAISYPYSLVKTDPPQATLETVTFVNQLNQVIAEVKITKKQAGCLPQPVLIFIHNIDRCHPNGSGTNSEFTPRPRKNSVSRSTATFSV